MIQSTNFSTGRFSNGTNGRHRCVCTDKTQTGPTEVSNAKGSADPNNSQFYIPLEVHSANKYDK